MGIAPKKAAASTSTATGAAPAVQTPTEGVRFGSAKTSSMVQTGLANDYWGAGYLRYGMRKYEKGPKAGQFYLAVILTTTPDDPEVPAKPEYMRAGNLDQWVPCDAEGNLPGGLTLEDFAQLGRGEVGYEGAENVVGTHVRPGLVGTQTGLPLGTKWTQFVDAVERAGYEQLDVDLSVFDGTRGFWHRVPFKMRGNDLVLDEGQRAPEVLIPTDFETTAVKPKATTIARGAPKPAASMTTTAVTPTTAATPKATAAPTPSPTPLSPVTPKPAIKRTTAAIPAVPIADRVALALVEVIAEHGGAVSRLEIGAEVMKKLPPTEGAKGVKILSDQTFLGSRDEFNYDPESDVLLLPGYAVDESGQIVQVDDEGNVIDGAPVILVEEEAAE